MKNEKEKKERKDVTRASRGLCSAWVWWDSESRSFIFCKPHTTGGAICRYCV